MSHRVEVVKNMPSIGRVSDLKTKSMLQFYPYIHKPSSTSIMGT